MHPTITLMQEVVASGDDTKVDVVASKSHRTPETDDYIKQAAGRSPAQEIADAKNLLETGTITQAEFDTLKAKALG